MIAQHGAPRVMLLCPPGSAWETQPYEEGLNEVHFDAATSRNNGTSMQVHNNIIDGDVDLNLSLACAPLNSKDK